MTDIVIPAWMIWLMGAFIPWAVWATVRLFQNEKDIALNTANDAKVESDLNKIFESIEKLNLKLDQFLAQEIHFLKSQMAKQ